LRIIYLHRDSFLFERFFVILLGRRSNLSWRIPSAFLLSHNHACGKSVDLMSEDVNKGIIMLY